jgi:predicted Zn-dependent peptidase
MYGDHPYARELPRVADVSTVTRKQVVRLHTERVRPASAVLVIVGDVSPARTLDVVSDSLASWDGTGRAERVPALPSFENGPVVLVDRPGSVQSSLRLGGVALRRDADGYPALQLANLVFGGYFSSRWNENIREDKGYTYGPHSRIEHNVLGSSLVLDADVATEVTAPALLETAYELGKISALPVTDGEVESVRQYAIGTLALSTATQAGLATTLSSLLGTGLGLDWMIEHPRRLAKVTNAEVSAAAAEFFAPARLVTVVVGDAASIATPLQALTRVVPDGQPS